MTTHEKAVLHIAKKLGALEVSGETVGKDQYIYFYLPDKQVVTRHILSITAEYRKDNKKNEEVKIYDAD